MNYYEETKSKHWYKMNFQFFFLLHFRKHQKDWEPNKNTRICSAHFINNQKSEHPLHPSYIPTIFPGKKNTKNNIQLVQRFERLQQRKSRTNIINNTIPNNKNNNNGLDTSNKTVIAADEDQNSSEIEPQNIETCHVSNIVLQAASRSVICQTEKLISESILDKHTYFFCNIHTSDGVSTAEVQVNLPIKKTSEKMCQVNFPTLRKPIKDMGCDLISQGSR